MLHAGARSTAIGDAVLLQNMYNLEVRNCSELSLMAKSIDRKTWMAPRGMPWSFKQLLERLVSSPDNANDIALSKLCSVYLDCELDKTLSTSDWAAEPLTDAQIHCTSLRSTRSALTQSM